MTESYPAALPQSWVEILQSEGYRITQARKAVIDIIATSQYVISPLNAYEKARKIYPKLGLVTVYRTLDKLEELGLIQRVHQPSGCHGFVQAFTGHQHLLICERCGKVEFFSGDEKSINSLIHNVEQHSGYHINEHWLQLFGICEQCRKSEKDGA